MTHIKIELNNSAVEEVNTSVIAKLYELAISGELDESSNLKGRLHATGAKQSVITYLMTKYPELYISVDSAYIDFADPVVENIVINWFFYDKEDKNGITENDLPLAGNNAIQRRMDVDGIGNALRPFSNRKDITTFNELSRFINVTLLPANFASDSTLYECDVSNILVFLNGCFFPTPLRSINLASAKTLETDAFRQCDQLTTVTFGNNITSVGERVFQQCTSLSQVNLSDVTIFLGSSMFRGCTNLRGSYELNITNVNSFSLTFTNCGIDSLTIHAPNWVNNHVSGAGINGPFFGMPNLTYLDLSDTKIDRVEEFRDCPNLVTLILPSTITFNQWDGVLNDKSLLHFVLLSTTPPDSDGLTYIFTGNSAGNANIYVPDESVDAYKAHEKWSLRGDKIKPISELPSTVTWATKNITEP